MQGHHADDLFQPAHGRGGETDDGEDFLAERALHPRRGRDRGGRRDADRNDGRDGLRRSRTFESTCENLKNKERDAPSGASFSFYTIKFSYPIHLPNLLNNRL